MLTAERDKQFPILQENIDDKKAEIMLDDIEDFISLFNANQIDNFGFGGMRYAFLLDTRFYALMRFLLDKNDEKSRDWLYRIFGFSERFFNRPALALEEWESKFEAYLAFIDERQRKKEDHPMENIRTSHGRDDR